MRKSRVGALLVLTLTPVLLVAQQNTGVVHVNVVPEKPGWVYAVGEKARFHVTVTRDGQTLEGTSVACACGPEMLPPTFEKTLGVKDGDLVLEPGTMREPGFLRCSATVKVDGREYRQVGTAGFAPDKIAPAVENPADFDDFWTKAKETLAKLPIDARLTPMPELSTGKVDVYHVSLQNVGSTPSGTSRFYGILAEPKGEGPFPAVMNPPGAGARPYKGMVSLAEKGLITLQVGIHGVPVNLPAELYDSLLFGPLAAWQGYAAFNLDDRDRYYFRRVYLGCLRANDFLASHPKWDKRNLIVTGGSQGGALTVTTAALDPRVSALAPFFPALADHTGYLIGRAGGWPHIFKDEKDGHRTAAKIKTIAYYDVVNFARRVKAPALWSFGFNDEICPPTSMYAAYNASSAPRKLLLALETGHFTTPEQNDIVDRFILEQAGVAKE